MTEQKACDIQIDALNMYVRCHTHAQTFPLGSRCPEEPVTEPKTSETLLSDQLSDQPKHIYVPQEEVRDILNMIEERLSRIEEFTKTPNTVLNFANPVTYPPTFSTSTGTNSAKTGAAFRREARAEAAELIADEGVEVITDLINAATNEDDPWEATRKVFSEHLHDWAAKFRSGEAPVNEEAP